MTIKLNIPCITLMLTLVLALGVPFTSVYANEGGHDEETPKVTVDSNDTPQIVKMKQMIALLTQIIELYKKKAELHKTMSTSDHHAGGEDKVTEKLAVWVELHSNQTHAHVQKPGMKEQSWLLADLKYTQEEEIIEAIVKKSGLTAHDIEEVIVFPSGKVDANGDSVEEHDEDADQDVSGIHIMANGKIMWGNGNEVHGATITTDDKVKLSNGTIITPKFDLR